MKQKFILFSIITHSIILSVCSQKISFSIQGGVSYVAPETYIKNYADSFSFIQRLRDSIHEVSHGFSQSSIKYKYNTSPGFGLCAGIHFLLTDRLRINSGIVAEYLSFSRKTEYLNLQNKIVWLDTVTLPDNPFGYGIDQYENSMTDLGPVKDGTDFQMLNLGIPMGLTYDIVPGKFFLNAGVYLQTPVNSSVKEEYYVISIRTENDINIGKYEIRKINDKTSVNFNRAQLSLSGSVGCTVSKQLSLLLGVTKTLNNVFVEDDLPFGFSQTTFNPFRLNLGMTIHLCQYQKISNK